MSQRGLCLGVNGVPHRQPKSEFSTNMTAPHLLVLPPTPVLYHTSWQDNHEGDSEGRSPPLNPQGVTELMMAPGQ